MNHPLKFSSVARPPRKQRGAALVIGLILLLVLTVLAISGVNSASLEFFMAGNEQFRTGAFQAAEAGIERAYTSGNYNPALMPQTVVGSNAANSTFTATITAPLGLQPLGAMGATWNTYSTFHYQIDSVGNTTRNAQALNTQGVAYLVPFDASSQTQCCGLGTGI